MGIHAGNRNRPAYSGQPRYVMPAVIRDLFKAREPLPFLPPVRRRKLRRMTPVSSFVAAAAIESPAKVGELRIETPRGSDASMRGEDERSDVALEPETHINTVSTFQTPAMRRAFRRKRRVDQLNRVKDELKRAYSQTRQSGGTETASNQNIHGSPSQARKTVFLYCPSLGTSDESILRECEAIGQVQQMTRPQQALKSCALLRALNTSKSSTTDGMNGDAVLSGFCSQSPDDFKIPGRYCFVEFSTEREALDAVRKLDGRRLDGARITASLQKAGTDPEWLPQRLRPLIYSRPSLSKQSPGDSLNPAEKQEPRRLEASSGYNAQVSFGAARHREASQFYRGGSYMAHHRGPQPSVAPAAFSRQHSQPTFDQRRQRQSAAQRSRGLL